MQENSELNIGNMEVFRLRQERKRRRKLHRLHKKIFENQKNDQPPESQMEVQEQSDVGQGMFEKAMSAQATGMGFVEMVSGKDQELSNAGELEDEVKSL